MTSVPESLEIEHKFEVPLDFDLPDLTRVPGVAAVGEVREHDLDATYHDTPRLALAGHRITLRRRSGGDDAGWHLKRPAGTDRSELRLPPGDDPAAVPDGIVAQVRSLLGGQPLVPVARVRTRRLERDLCGADGRVLAAVADDMVTAHTMRGPLVSQRWREIEVELREGGRDLLDAAGVVLAGAGARPAVGGSKLARALAGRYPDPARVARTGPAGAAGGSARGSGAAAGSGAGGGDPLPGYLRAQRDALVGNETGVRAGDADAVHDMRVAARRLRATLRTFRPLLDRARTEPLRAELRWLGGLLGPVRDSDVLTARFDAALADQPPELVLGPVAATIRGDLAAGGARARQQLIAALDSPRYAHILASLDSLLDHPPAPVPPGALLRRIRKALRRADRLLDAATSPGERDGAAAGGGGGSRDARLHEARKAYKRARYAVEVLAPDAGRPARRLAGRLADLQDVLGVHQDAVVAAGLLHRYALGAHARGENAFSYGLLYARERQAADRALAGLDRARRRATRRKSRRWLKSRAGPRR